MCSLRKGRKWVERPNPIGWARRLESLKAEPSGQAMYHIQTVGERRFRILNIIDGNPYLKAEVEYMEEAATEDLGDLTHRVSASLSEYLQLVVSFKKGWIQTVDTPQEPLALSYAASQAVTYPPDGRPIPASDSVGEGTVGAGVAPAGRENGTSQGRDGQAETLPRRG